MSKLSKTVLICVAAVVAVLAVGRVILGVVAQSKMRHALSNIPGVQIDVKKAGFSLIAGSLNLRDVDFAVSDSVMGGQRAAGHIEAIKVKRLSWRRLLRKEVFLGELRVENGSVALESVKSPMKVSAKDISFSVHDIGIPLSDSGAVEYNDSTYSVAIDSLDYTDDAGLSRIVVGHLSTADAGPVLAESFHFYNCVPMEKLAEKMGKVAAMWCDVKLDTLLISDINIPRAVKYKNIDIENVRLTSPEMVMFQDDRYPPAVPYPTFQESLNTVEIPLMIHRLEAGIKKFTFVWETKPGKRGSVPLYNVDLAIESASNAPGNVMKLDAHGARKGHCSASFSMQVKNDKPETTRGKMQVKNLDVSALDGFIGPVFGVTAKANIHQIDCDFQGEKNKMKADFCMRFENLAVKATDSGVLTTLASIALPKANPAVAGTDPKKVEYTFERDPMKPYPAYLIQSVTVGMLHTVLPGGKIKKKK